MGLETSEGDDQKVIGYWRVNDYSPQLLKACANLLSQVTDTQSRQRLTNIINAIWEHLEERQDGNASKYAWDNLEAAFEDTNVSPPQKFEFWPPQKGIKPTGAKRAVGNWYYTFRVVEGLVATAKANALRPETAKQVQQLALQLIAELEWELLKTDIQQSTDADRYAERIAQARALIEDRPAIAFGIASDLATRLASR